MQNLNIGLLQFDQAWEDKSLNYQKIRALIESDVQLDLLLIPEMFNTGFSMNTNQGESMENSEGINFLKTLSSELNCAIFTSLIISEEKKHFNRGVFIDTNQNIELYDKRKTFGLAGEDKVFKAGETPKVVEFKGWKINLQICYDLRFPELTANRLLADGSSKFDVILYVANWPEKRQEHWNTLLKARAIENQSFVIACNRVGIDFNNITYSGGSCVINAVGTVMSKESSKEELILTTIDKSDLNEIRDQLPFLKDR
ncbi:MAG: nitrilase-related carbon-nitrogen hydrolase [Crocinitomicaceae bacterium]